MTKPEYCTYLVKCPQCKNKMKYLTIATKLSHHRKQCVYCGFSILAKDNLMQF